MRSHWHVWMSPQCPLYLYPERKTHSVGRRSMVLLFPSISSHEAGIVSQSPMTRYPMPEVQSSTHSCFNTDYGSSEPLKTLVMYCIMLCNSWSLGPVTDNTASDSIGSRTPNAVSSYPLTSDSTSVSYLAAPLLFLVIRLMFQTRHIKIYHSTWQSHCHRFTKAFIVAIHLTLANDLFVFLSWTPMKMSTTYSSGSQTFWAADPFCWEIFFADVLAARPTQQIFRHKPFIINKPTVIIRRALF